MQGIGIGAQTGSQIASAKIGADAQKKAAAAGGVSGGGDAGVLPMFQGGMNPYLQMIGAMYGGQKPMSTPPTFPTGSQGVDVGSAAGGLGGGDNPMGGNSSEIINFLRQFGGGGPNQQPGITGGGL